MKIYTCSVATPNNLPAGHSFSEPNSLTSSGTPPTLINDLDSSGGKPNPFLKFCSFDYQRKFKILPLSIEIFFYLSIQNNKVFIAPRNKFSIKQFLYPLNLGFQHSSVYKFQ